MHWPIVHELIFNYLHFVDPLDEQRTASLAREVVCEGILDDERSVLQQTEDFLIHVIN